MAERKYWKGIEDRTFDENAISIGHSSEFAEELPTSNELEKFDLDSSTPSRRDFLKLMGFSVTAAAIAASCEMPIRKSIPYLVKPDEIVPGIANYYASSFYDGSDYASVLVKSRDGRPIKIEGNSRSKVTFGGTSAIAQASVLNLYDTFRGQHPKANGEKTTWEELDKAVKAKLDEIKAAGGEIRILSSSIISPSTKEAIKKFTEAYPKTQHVTYDAISYNGLLNANEKSFGKRVMPGLLFDKASLIVSLGADFLGTWGSVIENGYRYATTRKVSEEKKDISRFIQVESYLSLSGSNADTRVVVSPSQEALAVAYLYNKITGSGPAVTISSDVDSKLNSVAAELKAAKPGTSLVISGLNDENVQTLVNAINVALGNIGTTIDFNEHSNLKQGDDKATQELLEDMKAGKIGAVIVYETNPVYDYGNMQFVKDAFVKTPLSVCLNERPDETSLLCKYYAPNSHYLESWNDLEPKNGHYSITQPTIEPLFNTRQASESLLRFAGNNTPYYDFVKSYWQSNLLSGVPIFNIGWDEAVSKGVFEKLPTDGAPAFKGDAAAAADAVKASSKSSDGVEVVLYQKTAIRDGKYAGNPWLQEMPDPVSKVTWDNYIAMSYQMAEKLGCKQALFRTEKGFGAKNGHGTYTDVVAVTLDGITIALPVIIQPGTPLNTVAIALGYGHDVAGKAGALLGQNVYNFVKYVNGARQFYATGAKLNLLPGKEFPIGQTQLHHTIDDGHNKRPLVKETTIEEYKKNPSAGNEDREEVKEELSTLYSGHTYPGIKWGMAIDLSTCFGCGACAVACMSENNVPVVGKDEVRRSREMHWIRIDRYYAGDPDNPSVIFQPMMCQHCDNAPCENVCPVSATNHSSEGLNQMAYNRCIGTRYCANNCPYKVRRFNWFDYQNADSFRKGTFFDNEHDVADMTNDLTRMVLNPDVTVRSRGVMEKCSFCVQRLQEGKLTAKKEGRMVKDGDIKTACQSACPANAITFGDVNNEKSAVRLLSDDERGFKVLEQIETSPAITYLTKIRNKATSEA